MKIKVRPDDFIVEEITSMPIGRTGPFAVFTLTKEGWNTTDLLRRLSMDLSIPFADFAYGGKKDRYGRTSQCITIDTKGLRYRAGLSVAEKTYSLRPLGRSDRQMGPAHCALRNCVPCAPRNSSLAKGQREHVGAALWPR